MTLLHAHNLSKRYGNTLAVNDVSFTLEAGEVLGLLGPNGAGKTTTMTMLTGLMKPDNGSITINGTTHATDPMTVRRRIGYVPQDLAIYPELSACENLRFFGGLYGLSGATLDQRIDAVLDVIGLREQASSVHTYSGGMKRRLNFGAALLHEPQLLILDEPTVGVDPQSRNFLLERIRQLGSDGVGVIYASHYMEEVEAICDRVAIMDQGRIVAMDKLDSLLRQTSGQVMIRVAHWQAHATEALNALAERIDVQGEHARVMLKHPSAAELAAVLNTMESLGLELQGIETQQADLESLFMELTGKRLRD